MRRDVLRLALSLALALPIVPAASHAQGSPQAAADDAQEDREPCDGKARMRGPVFARQSGNVLPDAIPTLDFIAEQIKTRCAGKIITIEGHTDAGGDAGYNKRLSEVRAREIKRLLVDRGVPASQLETVGFGATDLYTTARGPEADALNRRITFTAKAASGGSAEASPSKSE